MMVATVVLLSVAVLLILANLAGTAFILWVLRSLNQARPAQPFHPNPELARAVEKATLEKLRSVARQDVEVVPDVSQAISLMPSDIREDMMDWVKEMRSSGVGWDEIRAGVRGNKSFDAQVEEM